MNKNLLRAIKNVSAILKEGGLTISVAESCTGGLLSYCLTFLPGSSSFFIAGVVSYSAYAKINILGVSPETISRHGVISKQTAEEMSKRIMQIAGSDYSISTTGNLGPDVLEGKERGLVYVSASGKGRTVSRELRLSGDRDANKEEACLSALNLLRKVLKG